MLNFREAYAALMTQSCVFCGAGGQRPLAACDACLDDLPWQNGLHCAQCGIQTQGELCGACLKTPPHFDRTVAAFEYAYPIDTLLQHYKYQHALHLANLLGTLLGWRLNTDLSQNDWPDALIAMPLHPIRLQQRGFNQSLEIAKCVANILQRPLLMQHSARIRHTKPQAQLKLKDRASNIRGAFDCKDLSGMHVALLDDVMTSGASLNELANMAKQAGATKVTCWVLARTQAP